MLGGSEIDVAAAPQRLPIGDDAAVGAQPRHAAVRIDAQAQMRRQRRVLDCEEVLRIASQRCPRQNFAPDRGHQGIEARDTAGCGDVDRALRRIIALEVRGVDVQAGQPQCLGHRAFIDEVGQ